MKRLTTRLTAAAFLALFALPATAQRAPQDAMIGRVASGLELTEAQTTKLRASIADKQGDRGAVSWAAAETLQEILTDAQKEGLLEKGKMAGAYTRGVRDGARGAKGPMGVARRGMAQRQDGRNGADWRARRPGARDGQMENRGMRGQNRPAGESSFDRVSDLTEDQKTALAAVRASQREAIAELRNTARAEDMNRADLAAKAREIGEASKVRAQEILTPEQQAQLQARTPQRRNARMSDGAARQRGMDRSAVRGNRQADGSGMAEALNLSADQKELLQIHQALTSQFAAQQARGAMNHSRRAR